jgi:predicted DNA-binding helix-hairpin-helix protein
MGVVLKRARFFLTCMGKYYGGKDLLPEEIRRTLSPSYGEMQLSMFQGESYGRLPV